MSSRFPETPSAAEAEGIPDLDEASGTDEAQEPPHDTAMAVDDFGTTAAEQHDGESLDGRLARETPEVLAGSGSSADEREGIDTPGSAAAGQGVGRIVEPDEGSRADTDSEMIGTDVGTDLGGYSAEESAMHLEPEA